MSQLAAALAVQPPTVTKMVTRLSSQGLVRREVSETDGRLARVYLDEAAYDRLMEVDRAWKRLEKEALKGIEDKDRKKLRKLLRLVEKNLAATSDEDPELDDDAADEVQPEDKTLQTVA